MKQLIIKLREMIILPATIILLLILNNQLLIVERKWFPRVTAVPHILWLCCYIKRYNER